MKKLSVLAVMFVYFTIGALAQIAIYNKSLILAIFSFLLLLITMYIEYRKK